MIAETMELLAGMRKLLQEAVDRLDNVVTPSSPPLSEVIARLRAALKGTP